MEIRKNISHYQLFCMLLLSRLLSLLTLFFGTQQRPNSTDCLVAVGCGGVFILAVSLPTLYYLNKYSNQSLLQTAYSISPRLPKIIAILYVIFYAYFAFLTLVTLKLFVATSVFPNDEGTVFMIICVLASCYAANLGIEALGRSSTVTLCIFLLSFFFIILTLCSKVSFTNFSPLLENGFEPSLSLGMRSAAMTYEISMLLFLSNNVKTIHAKQLLKWIACLICFIFVIIFFTFGGLGSYATYQLFPVYSMSVLSEFSVFQRFDVLLTGIWILTAFLKISLLLFLQSELLKKTFGCKKNGQYIYAIGILLLLIQFMVRDKLRFYLTESHATFKVVVSLLFVFILPSLFIFLDYQKGKHHAK